MASANWSIIPGDVTEVNEETAAAWVENNIAKHYVQEEVKVVQINAEIPLENPPVDEVGATEPLEIKHVGGGWYQLPNGEKVQGKEEAQEALKELQGSDE